MSGAADAAASIVADPSNSLVSRPSWPPETIAGHVGPAQLAGLIVIPVVSTTPLPPPTGTSAVMRHHATSDGSSGESGLLASALLVAASPVLAPPSLTR